MAFMHQFKATFHLTITNQNNTTYIQITASVARNPTFGSWSYTGFIIPACYVSPHSTECQLRTLPWLGSKHRPLAVQQPANQFAIALGLIQNMQTW